MFSVGGSKIKIEILDALGRPKRLFIFVNPYGRKKSELKIFETEVKPLLDDANIDFTVQDIIGLVVKVKPAFIINIKRPSKRTMKKVIRRLCALHNS